MHRLLTGCDAGIYGGHALCETPGGSTWLETPGYCGDLTLCVSELKKLGVFMRVLPFVEVAPKRRSKTTVEFVPAFLAAFVYRDRIYVTTPHASEAQAAATALWFVLDDKSRVT